MTERLQESQSAEIPPKEELQTKTTEELIRIIEGVGRYRLEEILQVCPPKTNDEVWNAKADKLYKEYLISVIESIRSSLDPTIESIDLYQLRSVAYIN